LFIIKSIILYNICSILYVGIKRIARWPTAEEQLLLALIASDASQGVILFGRTYVDAFLHQRHTQHRTFGIIGTRKQQVLGAFGCCRKTCCTHLFHRATPPTSSAIAVRDLTICSKIATANGHTFILVTVGVGGLHLPKVLKNMTNMFSKYNIYTGTFDLGMKLYMI
jgi:hypothetical protein